MRLNIDRDQWLDTWPGDIVMGYWSVAILFWQVSIDPMVSVQFKRCGLAKTRLRHPSLPFDSLSYPPVQSVDTYVRTYTRSITWQPNERWFTIFYEYGALSHGQSARGSPAITLDGTVLLVKTLCVLSWTEKKNIATIVETPRRTTSRRRPTPICDHLPKTPKTFSVKTLYWNLS